LKSNLSDDGPEGLRYTTHIERARPRLGRLASTFLFFSSVGSTNDVALERSATRLARQRAGLSPRSGEAAKAEDAEAAAERSAAPEDPEGLVVVADQQTAGRGRRGHSWFSPPGSGLYVSVVLAPARSSRDPARATSLMTLAAGVALAEGVAAATGLRVDLKWPNDLYVTRRKLAGILAEGAPDGAVVVGYGINIGATAFPPELGDRATSVESELGRTVDRSHVLVETLAALSRRYEDLLAGRFDAILDAWHARAPGSRGARVQWETPEGPQSGTTDGVDAMGALLVRVGARIERLVAGEVIWT
jgi:BirA family transcriptional regulator, biotin operon repressor / biotin---[acetyl-CoA-carboxylase] ligase